MNDIKTTETLRAQSITEIINQLNVPMPYKGKELSESIKEEIVSLLKEEFAMLS